MWNAHRAALVDTLLNSLEAERHFRAPLLETVTDELEDEPTFAPALASARNLLSDLLSNDLAGAAFVSRVAALRELVQSLGA